MLAYIYVYIYIIHKFNPRKSIIFIIHIYVVRVKLKLLSDGGLFEYGCRQYCYLFGFTLNSKTKKKNIYKHILAFLWNVTRFLISKMVCKQYWIP